MNIRGCRICVLLAATAASWATADVLTARSKEHRGRFAGFDGGHFLLVDEMGEVAKYPRSVVDSLVLDAPCEVQMVRSSKTTPEAALLHGYKQSKFTLEQNGARQDVAGLQVKKLDVGLLAGSGGPAGPFAAGADVPGPRPAVDLSALEKAGGLTPAQQAALDRYRRARQEYDAFLSKSTAMVTEMEKATGARRESLLNALRQRKNEEQPISRRLESAEAALLAVLPKNSGGSRAAGEAGGAAGQPAGHAAARGSDLAAMPEGQVVLLDLGDLERLPNLKHDQSAALRQYNTAKSQYLKAEGAEDTAQPGAMDAAVKALKEAQAAVLHAFPGVKFQ